MLAFPGSLYPKPWVLRTDFRLRAEWLCLIPTHPQGTTWPPGLQTDSPIPSPMVSQPAQTHRGTEPSGCKGSLFSPGVLGHALEEDGNGFSPRRGYCLWNIPHSAGRDSQEDAAVTLCPASPVSIQETRLALPGPSQRFQDNPHPPSPHPPKHSPPSALLAQHS